MKQELFSGKLIQQMHNPHHLLDQARGELLSRPEPLIRQIRQTELDEIGYLVRFVEVLPKLVDKSQLESSMAEFHNHAGRLPYWQDYDIGALILESVADGLSDGEEKKLFYRHALFRAKWCASCATSGGQGIARSRHIEELEKKNN